MSFPLFFIYKRLIVMINKVGSNLLCYKLISSATKNIYKIVISCIASTVHWPVKLERKQTPKVTRCKNGNNHERRQRLACLWVSPFLRCCNKKEKGKKKLTIFDKSKENTWAKSSLCLDNETNFIIYLHLEAAHYLVKLNFERTAAAWSAANKK